MYNEEKIPKNETLYILFEESIQNWHKLALLQNYFYFLKANVPKNVIFRPLRGRGGESKSFADIISKGFLDLLKLGGMVYGDGSRG